MHDIRWIRDNAEAFDRALNRRPLDEESRTQFSSKNLLALDEERRKAILHFEQAQARRNAASKEIGQAKAKKDEATAEQLMAEVFEFKTQHSGAGSTSEGGGGGAEQGARQHSEPAARRSAGRRGRDTATSSITSSAPSANTRSSRSSISNWAKRSA